MNKTINIKLNCDKCICFDCLNNGSPLGSFVSELNVAFISRIELSNSNLKLCFRILIQTQIWSFVSKSLLELEFEASFPICYSHLNSNLKLGFSNFHINLIWSSSLVSKFFLEIDFKGSSPTFYLNLIQIRIWSLINKFLAKFLFWILTQIKNQ